MAGPPLHEVQKGERVEEVKIFSSWKGVNTRANRTTIPHDTFYNLENLQPIGSANAHSVPNILVMPNGNYGSDIIYYSRYANVGGVDYIFNFSTSGKVFAYNLISQTSVRINPANTFSGSNSAMDQWNNTTVLFVDSTGYYSWDGTTFTLRTGFGVGFPTGGNAIAVYAGRVWIAIGRLILFSVAAGTNGAGTGYGNNANDWNTANGAGNIILTDPQIRNGVSVMYSANGYLYVFAGSAINVIADVYVPTGASPPTPVFTNLNVQGIIGTDQPYSVFPFNRQIMFANKYGAWALSGTTAQKISDDIDGTWQWVDLTRPISGGQVVVNNILTAAFLINRKNDPIFGSNTVIGMWSDNKWWFGNYTTTGTITLLASAIYNNLPALYGFIGNVMYQMFGDTTSSPDTAFMTPLWSMDNPIRDKEVMRAAVELQIVALAGSVQFNLDTLTSTTPFQTVTPSFLTWVNASATTVVWQNNALATVQWVSNQLAGLYTLVSGPVSPGFSKYVGISGTTSGMSFQLSGAYLSYKWAATWNSKALS